MAKFFPNLVERETVADAKAIVTLLQTHNKVYVEEVKSTYDWLVGVSFAESIPYVIDVTSQTAIGRLIKPDAYKVYSATLSTADITAQLGGLVLEPQEVAVLKFNVAGILAGANINTSITNLSGDEISEFINAQEQTTVDEDGIVVVRFDNEGTEDFTFTALEISVVELVAGS